MKEKRETVQMLVNVRLRYDTPKARREALAAVREHLAVSYSSAGDGWFHVESGRVQLAPRPKTPNAE
jgi:hypothetical protein